MNSNVLGEPLIGPRHLRESMMWKVVKILASMVASGIVTLFVTMIILMEMGSRYHGSYEHYGQYPVLLWGLVLIGFLAPAVVIWHMDRRGSERARKIVNTLALMVASGIITLFVAVFILIKFEGELQGTALRAALYMGAYGLAFIAFLTPGIIDWYRRNRGARKKGCFGGSPT